MKNTILAIISFFFIGLLHAASTAQPIATRTITFVNQCSFPVWFGFAGGSTESKNPQPGNGATSCASDSDCYAGSACVRTGAIKQCFWINPQPSDGNYQLAPNGGKNTVTIPIYNNNIDKIWSGASAGRTGCANGTCETATCSNNSGACDPSRGFDQPATQAEFTFNSLPNSVDFYDIEVINGVSIPLMMSPDTTNTRANDPYFCGTPGSNLKQGMLGQCTWNFIPPSNDYQWVKAGGNTCNLDEDCSGTDKCGLSFNPGKSPLLQKTCGKLLGYWTADQVCGYNPNQGAPFNCNQPLQAPQQNLTMNNLYGCTGVGSCYQQNAKGDCCGCVNWNEVGVDVPATPYTQQCVAANPTWTSSVQPQLLWIKQACPTVYTYPYDDMSSTFTCQEMHNNTNNVNYTITYCPGT